MISTKIGFIGAGQMAKAFGLSLVRKGISKSENIWVSCPEEPLLIPWKEMGCNVSDSNENVISNSQTVIWAVKPQIFSKAVEGIQEGVSVDPKFHVSVMAGIPLDRFRESIAKQFPSTVISTARVMPNIAMKVGSGCSVFTVDKSVSLEDKNTLNTLLQSVGLCYEVPESQINAYCGLFSSGIGFMCPILEALSDGAVKMGIPRDLSLQIAAQTMKGAAELILADKCHPGVLKDSVCSPGGTTIAGVSELEKHGIRSAIISAVEAATLRGEELGKKKS